MESPWNPTGTPWNFPSCGNLIRLAMAEQGRTDFFVGANIFVYYSIQQAREVYEEETKGLEKRAFRGPDVFWVGGIDPNRDRQAWISWEEGGRLPDVNIELLSPSTAQNDRTRKKDLYAQVFRTAEYFLYDPDQQHLEGFRLADRFYQPIQPDANGRLWSEKLGAALGLWQGEVEGRQKNWVRLFHPDGTLVPTEAEAERQRADAAEAELARLRALLDEHSRG